MITSTKISPDKLLKSQAKGNDFQGNNKENRQVNSLSRYTSLDKMVNDAKIDLSQDITKPPVVLKVDDTPLFFLGDFSLTIGKAKSRKTFLNSLLIAALVGNNSIGNIKSTLPEEKRVVLLFDTEQGSYHAHQAAKRVLDLLGVADSLYFKAYSLRKFSTKERLQIIEYVIYNTPDVGVVFIDGIRDLVYSINDENEATKVVSKLLKWSQALDIHISCTLHMNKGDNNARGHLGTELLNKSLVTISVSKWGPEGKFSKVQVSESREKEPLPFLFEIDNTGLPFIVPESYVPYMRSKKVESISPDKFEIEEHRKKIRHIFSQLNTLPYGQLVNAIKAEYNFGTNKAKDFVRYFSSEDFITGVKHGNKTIYKIGSV
jgi:hypothetical protein